MNPRLVVLLGCLLLTALDLAYIARYGRSVPIWDDFMVVEPMVGDTPVVSWLWAQHNFHRIPLPKLIYFICIKLTHWNFRTSMYLTVLTLGTLSVLLTEGIRRLRAGRSVYADLFFPLILMHGGHCANMLLSSQIDLVLPVATICMTLLLVCRISDRLTSPLAWQMTGVACLIFLNGGFGLTFLMTFGCWLIYAGLPSSPSQSAAPGGNERSSALSILLGLLVLGMLGLYFVGYHRPTDAPRPPGIGAVLATSIEFLATMFGTAARKFWNPGIGAIAALIVVTMSLIPLYIWLRRPAERLRAAGILAFMAGIVGLALGIGWSRSGFGPLYGLQPRYVTLATMILICAYFVVELYTAAKPKRIARSALLFLALALFLIHIKPAINYGSGQSALQDQFLSDLRARVPREVILERYVPKIDSDPAELNRYLDRLHRAGVAPY
ncbi:MAG TPA: hypothetical protein VL282_13395 [Tepidisphaeraceae bacterium]|nr:hypothetical protein [Tepidisphaeraceae bacterium]